jgi:hypothetical protein
MPDTAPPRVLVVANRTASTPALLAEVERRAKAGARFSLMVPPDPDGTDWTAEDAKGLVERAAGGTVDAVEPGDTPADTIHGLVADGSCDQVIVSTTPAHHRHWFHHDLPSRLKDLKATVTVIPPEPDAKEPIEGFPPDWQAHVVNPAGTAGLGNY